MSGSQDSHSNSSNQPFVRFFGGVEVVPGRIPGLILEELRGGSLASVVGRWRESRRSQNKLVTQSLSSTTSSYLISQMVRAMAFMHQVARLLLVDVSLANWGFDGR